MTTKIIAIISVIVVFVLWAVCAVLASNLRFRKGYTGGEWIGIAFGIIGLIYCAGLPLAKDETTPKWIQGQNNTNETPKQ